MLRRRGLYTIQNIQEHYPGIKNLSKQEGIIRTSLLPEPHEGKKRNEKTERQTCTHTKTHPITTMPEVSTTHTPQSSNALHGLRWTLPSNIHLDRTVLQVLKLLTTRHYAPKRKAHKMKGNKYWWRCIECQREFSTHIPFPKPTCQCGNTQMTSLRKPTKRT